MTITLDDLSHIEIIRKRPGMYVGDTHTHTGPHQLLLEVLANAVDEHLAGRCTCIDVTMQADGSLSVSDDGTGISVEVDEHGTPWLESVLTTLHNTPTADGHAPHVHLRRHHVGLCTVSALSSSLSAEVRRDGQTWRIELEEGRVTKKLAMVGPAETSGTTIRFKPDASIFAVPDFEVERVARRVRKLSALLPGLTTRFSCDQHEYASDQGVVQLLALTNNYCGHHVPATGEAKDGEASAQVAFEWSEWPEETRVIGYCNLDTVPEGTHIDGFRRGLADALGRKDYARVYEALSRGLNAVVSVLVIDPNYQSPTRSKIASKEARAVVREATKRALEADPALREYLRARLKTFENK